MPLPLAAIATAGLPFLAELVRSALGRVDNPIAQGAAQALGQVTRAINSGEITPEQMAEGNRHVESMTKLDNERDIAMQQQVNETMRSEVNSEDAWARRWRPFFGYTMALTWGLQMLALSYAVIVTPAQAPGIIQALGEGLATMWWVGLTVLGVAVVKRSEDKAIASGAQLPPGAFARAVEAYTASRRTGS